LLPLLLMMTMLPGRAVPPFLQLSHLQYLLLRFAGWALAAVTSRAFRVAGPAAPAALLPLIDMANHSFEPNCEVVPVPGGVAMVAKKQVGCIVQEATNLYCYCLCWG
jgi:histone-lysine N-methyltransferase SETD3